MRIQVTSVEKNGQPYLKVATNEEAMTFSYGSLSHEVQQLAELGDCVAQLPDAEVTFAVEYFLSEIDEGGRYRLSWPKVLGADGIEYGDWFFGCEATLVATKVLQDDDIHSEEAQLRD